MRKPFVASDVRHLFHGTGATLDGALRPGGYDGVFWSAELSTVAQTYIPATGSSLSVSISSSELRQRVRPDLSNDFLSLARMVGPVPYDIEVDALGRAKSWKVPDGCVTYDQVAQYLEKVLGYTNLSMVPGEYRFEVLTSGWAAKGGPVFHDASYRRPGALIVLDGFQGMRFLDLSRGESDLTSLQYHRLSIFRRAEAEGFDGVVIDDFAQSKQWGDVDHRSIGFFQKALANLQVEIVPCVRFDWGPSREAFAVTETPEFLAWSQARAARATLKQLAGDRAPGRRATVLGGA